jgi:MFS family permease
MSRLASPAIHSNAPRNADRRLVIAALGLTQIIGYGSLYYAFSVLAPAMASDLHWSTEWVFGGLSIALLAAGLAAPTAGRLVDRYGAGQIMTIGSLAAALALTFWALVPGKIAFVLGLVAIEGASTFVQYNAAFALLVQIDHKRASRNITYLTLIAGFASTLFWPLTAALQQHLTWREVYLVFAATNLLICMPIHFWLSGLSRPGRTDRIAEEASAIAASEMRLLPSSLRPRAFVLMAVGFALLSFVNAATLVHMLPVLTALGLGALAVLVGTLFGPAQVLSRLINMIFGTELSAPKLAIICAILEPLGIAILLLSAPWVPGAVAFSIVFGLGSGLSSIVQGTLPLHLFGKDGYGELVGRIAAVRLIVAATAPFVFAILVTNFGVVPALAVTVVLGLGSILAFLWLGQISSAHRRARANLFAEP